MNVGHQGMRTLLAGAAGGGRRAQLQPSPSPCCCRPQTGPGLQPWPPQRRRQKGTSPPLVLALPLSGGTVPSWTPGSFPAEVTPTWRVPVPHPQQGSSSPSIPRWGSAKSHQRPCSQAVSLQRPRPQHGLALSLSRMRPFRGDAMRQVLVPGQLLRANCGSKVPLDREERFDSKASLISCVCPGPVEPIQAAWSFQRGPDQGEVAAGRGAAWAPFSIGSQQSPQTGAPCCGSGGAHPGAPGDTTSDRHPAGFNSIHQ